MKKAILLASALLLALPAAMAQQLPGEQKPYVQVNGTAEKRVTPNKIMVAVSLNQADSKGKISMADLEKSFANALSQSGIDIKEQVVVTDQSSSANKKQTIYQFKNYTIALTNAAEVSTLFDNLSANNISNAEVTTATRSDMSELEQQTKIEAVKNAQQTATVLAEALGQSIGKAIMIEAYSNQYTPVVMLRGTSKLATVTVNEDAAPLNDVQFQEIRVEQRVTVRFILE